MPSKKIKISGTAGEGTQKINGLGFPKIQKQAVSRSKVYRIQKELEKKGETKEIIGDPACNVKGRGEMGQVVYEKFNMYRSPTAIGRLEQAGAPVVKLGATPLYCTESFFWWLKEIYLPERNKKLAKNFWTDPTLPG